MKKFAFYLFLVPVLGICLSACSEEDNGTDVPEVPQEDFVYVEDELAVLQNHLVKVDEEGNLVEHIWGEVLNAATPDEVTIGVDNLAEAVEIFRGFFAETTEISDDGMLATFSVQKGSAELKGSNGENGLVAYATFDVPGLMYVSRINFILNSAWPENTTANGFHKLGVFYEYKGFIDHDKFDGFEKYMCIREYDNGKPALLFAITKDKFKLKDKTLSGRAGGNMPNENKAKEIAGIIQTDWSSYSGKYNKVYGENVLNVNEGYYYGKATSERLWFIRLSNSQIDHNTSASRRRVLFYMESCEKM